MPIDPNRVLEIFAVARGKSNPPERAAYLEGACGADAELRDHVLALLHAEQQPIRAEAEATTGPPQDVPASNGAEQRGTLLAGRYKLLQKLGEGGMGEVWMAEQSEPVKRLVAIKIIKAGMDSTHVLARFEAERQALAMMDHPNIAKVLDGGMTGSEPAAQARDASESLARAAGSGRPFFVMELVKGIPFTKYCDQEKLTPRERLELFIPVCQAVQHAHQKGIIHRDLKPSNILIALYDGKPVPKVIDFGVAKATMQKLTERTLFTEVGQFVGTPAYMPPEQAELNNLDIDTRADIYSLGVVLYELLTGTPPFTNEQLRNAGFAELLRIIREVEPSKPSTKLSSSESLPSVAALRRLEPKRLTKLVSGDLDWIVMKCLEKERARRYATANGLAQDIQRYLSDEPVSGGRPSAGYRLRRFVRRNRGPVIAATLVLVALTFGIIGTTLGLFQAKSETKRANGERERADREANYAIGSANEAREKEQIAVAAQKELQIVNESLLIMSARALLAPLQNGSVRRDEYDFFGLFGERDEVVGTSLSVDEMDVFWELASHRGTPLNAQFLIQATRSPRSCNQLAFRAEVALQATIGLEVEDRNKAERLLASQISKFDVSDSERFALAAACSRLGLLSPSVRTRVTEILTVEFKLDKTDGAVIESDLAFCLAALALQMEPELASAFAIEQMRRIRSGIGLRILALSQNNIVARMDLEKAASVCETAVGIITHALESEHDLLQKCELVDGLLPLLKRTNRAKAVAAFDKIANDLTSELRSSRAMPFYGYLARNLVNVTNGMEPAKRAKVFEEAMRPSPFLTGGPNVKSEIDRKIDDLRASAQFLTRSIKRLETEHELNLACSHLSLVNSGIQARNQAAVLCVGAFLGQNGMLSGWTLLGPRFSRDSLSEQTLVDLLKHPFCVGHRRRAVLDALGLTYNRTFADQWDFVRFVKEKNLPLDLLTPPKRPEPK